MVKNAFYFILKTLFVLKIFVLTFLVMWENGLIRKVKIYLGFYGVTTCLTNNYNTHISKHLKK